MTVDVLLPINVETTYEYLVPKEFEDKIKTFIRVLVPLGKSKTYSGLIVNINKEKKETSSYKLKPLLEILDKNPIVNSKNFEFWQWLANYYLCSLGDVMNAALPSALKLESHLIIIPTINSLPENISDKEKKILSFLLEHNATSISVLENDLKIKGLKKIINDLSQKGYLSIESKIRNKKIVKTEKVITLNNKYKERNTLNNLVGKLEKAPAQQIILLEFIKKTKAFHNDNPIIKKVDLTTVKKSPSAYKSLLKKEIFIEKEEETHNIYANEGENKISILSPSQQKALNQIKKIFQTKKVALLHGVTSSGKTEIYIHLIQETLQAGKQVLYLLPEIAITAQIINRLKKSFGNQVGIYHSKSSDTERYTVWNAILNGKGLNIILGVRSAIFLPFNNLGLIIVDEEHENTYKQFEPNPRYHARDMSIVLANIFNSKVLLGSATPSLESYYNAVIKKKYGYVPLKERFGNVKLPAFEIVDMKKEWKEKKNRFSFSSTLINRIEEALKNKEQIILFQNRRGYAPYAICTKCGYIEKCHRCDVSLTYHKEKNKLVCHYCDYTEPIPVRCPECGGEMILNNGVGTEKVQEEASILFPTAHIGRMDLDSMRKKKAHEKLLQSFENKEIDILIGTQMVTKGLDFENVSIVGVIDVDSMINFPDFRAYEHTFQLILQVSGRAGRKSKQGLVILQTAQPQHPLIKQIIEYNYSRFFKDQLEERQKFGYPPFTHFVKIIVRHRDYSKTLHIANTIAQSLSKHLGNNVVKGPAPALISRIRNKYYFEIAVKINNHIKYNLTIIKQTITNIQTKPFASSVEIIVDVDSY